jgi:predicted transcriptional regulator
MTIKEELHSLVDSLEDVDAKEALDYLRWLASDSETLTEEELAAVREGEAQAARGEYATLAELHRMYDE